MGCAAVGTDNSTRGWKHILSQLDGAVRYPGMAGSLVGTCCSCTTRPNTNSEGRQAARISNREDDEAPQCNVQAHDEAEERAEKGWAMSLEAKRMLR